MQIRWVEEVRKEGRTRGQTMGYIDDERTTLRR